jgi:uncharacterized protein (TIGR04141 family)
MAKTRTVSIYLLKSDVGQAREALRQDPGELTEHRFSAAGAEGVVYVAPTPESIPDWVEMLEPVTQPPVHVRSQSPRAVLVLNTAGRWFAVTFGYGRTLLEPGRYERRFGLRAALNTVDPGRLRSAQARTFNDYVLQTQRQVSRVSRVEALELDVERDLVTALGGSLSDEALGRRIDGRDAVRLTAELDAAELVKKCRQLLDESRRTRYRKEFPWIDTIEEVTDPEAIADLESRIAERLARRAFAGIDLFPPELVNDEIVEYRLSPSHGGRVVVEPDPQLLGLAIPHVMNGRAARAAVERHRLIGFDSSGTEVRRWPFWDCLHAEFVQDGMRVVLDDGRWYRIERRFANEVDRFAARLRASGLAFPLARREEREGDYNIRAAARGGFALLDKRTIRLPSRTPIEVCDLFGEHGHLVHVKRRKGGSSSLSHLIGQASVSARLLLDEPAFRAGMRGELKSAKPGYETKIAEPARAAEHPVVLALITNSAATRKVAESLPFFSKVFLRQNARQLQGMGFEVFIDEIAVEPAQVSRRRPRPARRRRAPTPPPGDRVPEPGARATNRPA